MFEIYFKDLKPEIQKELLEWYGIKDEYELNWDVFPLTVIDKPEKDWNCENND